jgi:hypothetical protein
MLRRKLFLLLSAAMIRGRAGCVNLTQAELMVRSQHFMQPVEQREGKALTDLAKL